MTAKLGQIEGLVEMLKKGEWVPLAQYGEVTETSPDGCRVWIMNEEIAGTWFVKDIRKFAEWYVKQERFKYAKPPSDGSWDVVNPDWWD